MDGLPDKSVVVNSNNVTSEANDAKNDFCQIYDVNYAGVEDKFANSILHIDQFIYTTHGVVSRISTLFLSQLVNDGYQTHRL